MQVPGDAAVVLRNLRPRPAAPGVIVTYLGTTIAAAIRTEEAFLRRQFGDAYQRYRAGSPAAVTRRFSFERVFANGEHRTIAGLLVVVLLLALKATYNVLFWREAGR